MSKPTFSKSSVVRWCLVPVALLLLYGAYLSFRWALADVLSEQVRYQLAKVQVIPQSMDAKQWQLTRDMLEKTLWLHPDYSNYLDLARFFYHVAGRQPASLLDELGWHDNQQKELDYTRRAILTRPSWPHFWAELIVNKIALNQFDGELTGAMARAITLGPWEYSVQHDIAVNGLEHWDKLEAVARRWVMLALNKSLLMERDPKKWVEELRAHANFGTLCQSVKEMPNVDLKMLARYCQ